MLSTVQAAFDSIDCDCERNSRAARGTAEAETHAEIVFTDLLSAVGLGQ
jgi:hypothetical protein